MIGGKIIWFNYISLTKTLVFWKLLYRHLPIDIEPKKIGVYLCFHMFFKQGYKLRILIIYFLIVLSFPLYWLRNIFPSLTNLSYTGFINFVKAPDSPLIRLIMFLAITFFLWMIWRMRNFITF